MTPRKHVNLLLAVFTGIAITICTSDTLTAQKKESDTSKSSATAKKSVTKKSKGRVPPHYGKLNLTKKQRDKIYEIKAGYKSQLDNLKKQLAELTQKQKSECEGVLTASQKSTLDKILADVASKRSKKTAKK
ncbi:MAG: hypothetical protein K0U86_04205 [Planctomycetes bacterium]|nr:hypothetical protein [Planctomycetota bacterium]MCH9724089.1 hypothetical protein [Planctomycetota bacterium]MCH9778145.1 hypothetical protein [Planctomycetota bacterium]MCH9793364.1 hypothetical protein [Planctomycetota bacterium]MDF1745936.1 hypothetical protein [Gimesia sp.]